jgi:homocysteine S-methyltransferase
LDECESLDSGDPDELSKSYRFISQKMPWLSVFGGCCGTDLRHVKQIAGSVLQNGAKLV